MVDEKQIQIIIDDEIIESIPDIPSWTRLDFINKYCAINNIDVTDSLEFTGFVAVFAEWR